jgi:isoamylase/glycogen operon protein
MGNQTSQIGYEVVDQSSGRRIRRVTSSTSILIDSRKSLSGAPWLSRVLRGKPSPYGCHPIDDNTVNFAIYCAEQRHVSLIIYHPQAGSLAAGSGALDTIPEEAEGNDDVGLEQDNDGGGGGSSSSFAVLAMDSCVELRLDPRKNRMGKVWHVAVQPLLAGYRYAWRVGHGKNAQIVLDPFARIIDSPLYVDFHAREKRKNKYAPIAVIPPLDYLSGFDWQGVRKPNIPASDLVIYEVHVRSFTALAKDIRAPRGTFTAMIEKIPYLQSLGVNCVEFLPVFEFNELEWQKKNPSTGEDLCQYWGYSTVGFFAPMNRFSVIGAGSSETVRRKWGKTHCYRHVLDEFRTMVRELHRAGIAVILDIVFNHTAETWKTYHFRALANREYYLNDRGHDANFSGCGHTFACNSLAGIELVHDCVRFWAMDMQVDGFRFDLAACLLRSPAPPFDIMEYPTAIQALKNDSALADVLWIAEPWDLSAYLVGHFAQFGPNWSDWNGKYRDCVRKFIKGDAHMIQEMATRICGSEDIYGGNVPDEIRRGHQENGHAYGVNFITCHDGMSLRDLVSYNEAQNWANGEDNRDGEKHNLSWNCGVEGETDDENVLRLRHRQERNFFLMLLCSARVPMIRSGDEIGHTQYGNSNVWCQDNALNYFHWDALESAEGRDLLRFVSTLIHFRKISAPIWRRFLSASRGDFVWCAPDASSAVLCDAIGTETANDGENPQQLPPLADTSGCALDWENQNNFMAMALRGSRAPLLGGRHLYLAFNAAHEPCDITAPRFSDQDSGWAVLFNTAAPSPEDCFALAGADGYPEDIKPSVTCVSMPFHMEPYSAILLVQHKASLWSSPTTDASESTPAANDDSVPPEPTATQTDAEQSQEQPLMTENESEGLEPKETATTEAPPTEEAMENESEGLEPKETATTEAQPTEESSARGDDGPIEGETPAPPQDEADAQATAPPTTDSQVSATETEEQGSTEPPHTADVPNENSPDA